MLNVLLQRKRTFFRNYLFIGKSQRSALGYDLRQIKHTGGKTLRIVMHSRERRKLLASCGYKRIAVYSVKILRRSRNIVKINGAFAYCVVRTFYPI